jgi:hypothetical protein
MERAQGLPISSALNERGTGNKPKGQIGFYNFVCIPLYQAVARIFPELEVNLEAVKANLERWKEILAQELVTAGSGMARAADGKADIPMTEQPKDDAADEAKK